MATNYGGRYEKPIGASERAMGGAAAGMGIDALNGTTDMQWTFDDFNGVMKGTEGFSDAAYWETNGWVLTDDPTGTPTADEINLNDVSNTDAYAPSCLYIHPGTADDSGGNMQLDHVNGAVAIAVTNLNFPHIYIPDVDAGVDVIDGTDFVFATRVGFRAGVATGIWQGKMFIGWAAAGDTSIMDHDTGVLTDAAGELHGFHINETGAIHGVNKRLVGDSHVEGTTYVEMAPDNTVDGIVANGAAAANQIMWFDMAMRMRIWDMSEDTDNGATAFFLRKVNASRGVPGDPFIGMEDGMNGWKRVGILENETPSPLTGAPAVPTIEVMNGVTAGTDPYVKIDWWLMGRSRYSRQIR